MSSTVVAPLAWLAEAGEVLHGGRRAAFERAQAMPLPTAEEEVWRYSRIGELRLDRYRLGSVTTEVELPPRVTHERVDVGQDVPAASAVTSTVVLSPARSESSVTKLGADRESSPTIHEGTAIESPPESSRTIHDVFDELAMAFATVDVLTVARTSVVAAPVVITRRFAEDTSICFSRLIVNAADDTEVTVIECFESADDLDTVIVPRVEINAGRGARVRYLAVNTAGTKTWLLGHQQATSARDADVLLGNVALGGHYARVRTDVRAIGAGATTRQIALYYADGEQMHDFRTLQDHVAPKTSSDLLFKGAVQDTAKSVYTGLIRIGSEAVGSSAFQTNRNLTLSEGAWAESVPNLDIATNDVRCSHASSIGPIDDEQRYYLESRGIPPVAAERLVVQGFFDEVLQRLPVDEARRADLHRRVADKLNRRTT